jgi:hypothetical protein
MSYEDFVMRTTRHVHTARSLDEAFRTPTYGSAMWRFTPNTLRELRAFAPAIVLLVIVVVVCFLPSVFTNMIERLT